MIEFSNFDKAVIVTGDCDFFCLVDYLIKKEKLKKLLVPNQYKFSSLYRKSMAHVTFMNNLHEKLGHERHKKKEA